jgi:hypothetical protein
MTFGRAITYVLATTLIFAFLGIGIGYVLGQFMPEYYRNIFRSGHDPQFDPLSVGLGQGLTQGTAAGVVIGLTIVALLCWRDTRLDRAVDGTPIAASNKSTSRRLLIVTGGVLLLIVSSGISFFLGALLATGGAYHQRYLEEHDALAPVLASDPAFADIQLSQRSNGGVNMYGNVSTQVDKERLQLAVQQAVGEARAKVILLGIGVSKPHEL